MAEVEDAGDGTALPRFDRGLTGLQGTVAQA